MRLSIWGIITLIGFAFTVNAAIPQKPAIQLPPVGDSKTTLNVNEPTATQPAMNATEFSCTDLKKAAAKLPVHVGNIANVKTTRTPDGGPYKRIELKCKELYCETLPQEEFRLVYEPSHPDANSSGYVRYPKIDQGTEFAALSNAATEVKLLASKEVCGAKAIATGNSALVKYETGSSVQSDTFNFTPEGKLSAWTRTLRDGTTKTFAFSPDGSVANQ